MNLDAEGLRAVAKLVSREDVCSLACYYPDPSLWDIFLREQAERANRTGLPPQVAFTLCGPDTGLGWEVDVSAYGGEVHIPYEGISGGDLFFQPHWRLFHPDYANERGRVGAGNIGKECHHLITANDYGDLRNSRKLSIGDYFLYESTLNYIPTDPLDARKIYARKAIGIDPDLWSSPANLRQWFDGQQLPGIFP